MGVLRDVVAMTVVSESAVVVVTDMSDSYKTLARGNRVAPREALHIVCDSVSHPGRDPKLLDGFFEFCSGKTRVLYGNDVQASLMC